MFCWLQQEGALTLDEMSRTFNCGLGAVLVVSKPDAQRVLRLLQAREEAWIVGSLAHRPPGETRIHRQHTDGQSQSSAPKKSVLHCVRNY